MIITNKERLYLEWKEADDILRKAIAEWLKAEENLRKIEANFFLTARKSETKP